MHKDLPLSAKSLPNFGQHESSSPVDGGEGDGDGDEGEGEGEGEGLGVPNSKYAIKL